MAQSLEKHPVITPGTYKGKWTAYYVVILFDNGNESGSIKLDGGVRGHNCDCDVVVDEDGTVNVS